MIYSKLRTIFMCTLFLPIGSAHAQPDDMPQDVVIEIAEDNAPELNVIFHDDPMSSTDPDQKWENLSDAVVQLQRKVDLGSLDPLKVYEELIEILQLLNKDFQELAPDDPIFRFTHEARTSLIGVIHDGYESPQQSKAYPGYLSAKLERLLSEIKKASQLSLFRNGSSSALKTRHELVKKVGMSLTLGDLSKLAQFDSFNRNLWEELKANRLQGLEIARTAVRESFVQTDLFLTSDLQSIIQVGKGYEPWRKIAEAWEKALNQRVIPFWDIIAAPRVPLLALEGQLRMSGHYRISRKEEKALIEARLQEVCEKVGVYLHSYTTREQSQSEIRKTSVHAFSYDGELDEDFKIPIEITSLSYGEKYNQWVSCTKCSAGVCSVLAISAAVGGLSAVAGDWAFVFCGFFLPAMYGIKKIPKKKSEVSHLLFDELLFIRKGPIIKSGQTDPEVSPAISDVESE